MIFSRQKRKKIDVEYNEEHDSFYYRQPITYFYRPDMTSGSDEDLITVPNLPFIVSLFFLYEQYEKF